MSLECSQCSHTTKTKKAMIAHFLAQHVPAEKAPFRCSLCGFVSHKLVSLQGHVMRYQAHVLRKLTCPDIDDSTFFVQSRKPYHVRIGRDYFKQVQQPKVKKDTNIIHILCPKFWQKLKIKISIVPILTPIIHAQQKSYRSWAKCSWTFITTNSGVKKLGHYQYMELQVSWHMFLNSTQSWIFWKEFFY